MSVSRKVKTVRQFCTFHNAPAKTIDHVVVDSQRGAGHSGQQGHTKAHRRFIASGFTVRPATCQAQEHMSEGE